MRVGRWPDRAKAAFAIRDDDVGGFAIPEMLQTVHKAAFSRGFKISFGIVPFQKGIEDPNVPPRYRATDKPFPIGESADLAEYIRSLLTSGRVDLTLHGVSHEPGEFASDDAKVLSRVRTGLECLRTTFGRRPTVFVPPWEILNRALYRVLPIEGLSISMSGRGFVNASPFGLKRGKALLSAASFVLATRKLAEPDLLPYQDGSVICPAYRYGDWRFSPNSASSSLFETWRESFEHYYRYGRCFLVGTHYWQCFFDWDSERPRPQMIAFLRSILDYVDRRGFVWKASLSDVARWIQDLRGLVVKRSRHGRTEIVSRRAINGLTIHLGPTEDWRGSRSSLEPRADHHDGSETALVFDMKAGDVLHVGKY